MNLYRYRVYHEKKGHLDVFAKDPDDAIEQYYRSIEGMIGHFLKICSCFGNEQPVDRSKVLKPTKVQRLANG